MTPTTFRYPGGEYPIYVEAGVLGRLAEIITDLAPRHRPVLIRDLNLATLQPAPIDTSDSLTFPAGEQHKARATWARLTDDLLAMGADRRTVIIAFGGGVTTDLAGFVAATFLRGVPWIAVPTTPLAACDAAIGGKTGVDTAAGKNLVGAFHHPLAVVADPQVFASLPQPVFVDGLAESIKHAAIADADFWEWLKANSESILNRDQATVTELLHRSIVIKAEIAGSDDRESGRRAVLNAGHTVAHGIEHASGRSIGHGSTVAIGLVREASIGEQLGVTAAGTAAVIAALLEQFGLPTLMPERLDRTQFAASIQLDKKNRGGKIHLALIQRIGMMAGSNSAGWTTELDTDTAFF